MNSKRVGVFADVSNLYHCIQTTYKSKLNYKFLMDICKTKGEVFRAIAYGAYVGHEADAFQTYLESSGFTPKFKPAKKIRHGDDIIHKADWDVGIAMDIVKTIDRMDIIVLATADSDLVPVVEWAIERGVDVIIIGCNISHELKEVATEWREIDKEYFLFYLCDKSSLSNAFCCKENYQSTIPHYLQRESYLFLHPYTLQSNQQDLLDC